MRYVILSISAAKCMFSICMSFCFFSSYLPHAITNDIHISDGLLVSFTVYFFNYSKSLELRKQ